MFGLFKTRSKPQAPAFRWGEHRTADGPVIRYRDYPGSADAAPVLCLHGLTRNSRDFEALALAIGAATGRRVIVPDMRGRGESDADPNAERYHPQTYVEDVIALMDDLGVETAIWVGTSMGGLMAMIASLAHPGRVAAAVLNDVGPELNPDGLKRIQTYVGEIGPVIDWGAAAMRIRSVNEVAFPERDEAFWMDFARKTHRETADGIDLDYDPAISGNVKNGDVAAPDMWPLFDGLKETPVLLIRGALSDILTADIVDRMRARKPDMETADVPQTGHAPFMTEPGTIEPLLAFLKRQPS